MERIYRGQKEVLPPQYISRGKTLPGIHITVYDPDSQTAINFSNATIVFLITKFDPDTELWTELTAENTPTGDVNGNLNYIFGVTDTSEAGIYFCQFDITHNDNNKEVFPELDGVRVNVI